MTAHLHATSVLQAREAEIATAGEPERHRRRLGLLRRSAVLGSMVLGCVLGLICPAAANNPNEDQLRVLTYNLCMSNATPTTCADTYNLALSNSQRLERTNTWVIHRDGSSKKPDVISLQEVAGAYVNDGATLTSKFPGYAIAANSTWRWILYNTATLKKIDSGAAAVNSSGKAFPWARFERIGKPANKVTVVNVHFANDEAPRNAEIARFRSSIGGELGTRTVFAGDFNAYHSSLASTFVPTFTPLVGAISDTNSETRRTATPKYPVAGRVYPYNPVFAVAGHASLRPVDHIYAGGGLTRVSSQIYKDLAEPSGLIDEAGDRARWAEVADRRSDHNALYSVVSW